MENRPAAVIPAPQWRGGFQNDEVNKLHRSCFAHADPDDDWWAQVNAHSLGWACLRLDGELAGFVNVAWDGRKHAVLLDLMVAAAHRRKGYGAALVLNTIEQAQAAGCQCLHVDFEPGLGGFYREACGFVKTEAGLLWLGKLAIPVAANS